MCCGCLNFLVNFHSHFLCCPVMVCSVSYLTLDSSRPPPHCNSSSLQPVHTQSPSNPSFSSFPEKCYQQPLSSWASGKWKVCPSTEEGLDEVSSPLLSPMSPPLLPSVLVFLPHLMAFLRLRLHLGSMPMVSWWLALPIRKCEYALTF